MLSVDFSTANVYNVQGNLFKISYTNLIVQMRTVTHERFRASLERIWTKTYRPSQTLNFKLPNGSYKHTEYSR